MFERCFTQKIEAALDFAEAGLVLSDRTLGTPEITVHNVELFLGVALFFWEKSRVLYSRLDRKCYENKCCDLTSSSNLPPHARI